MSWRVPCAASDVAPVAGDMGQVAVSTPGSNAVSTPMKAGSAMRVIGQGRIVFPCAISRPPRAPMAGVISGTFKLSPVRKTWRVRALMWAGRRQINLGLLIPVNVRRGGWRQRLANALIRRGTDCLVRAFHIGARP